MYIYKITNLVNNKVYVGQTKTCINLRFKNHCHSNEPSMPINLALKKYGSENFTIEVLDIADNIDDLNAKEIYWISKLNSLTPSGYNIRCGGDRPPQSFIENGIIAAQKMTWKGILRNCITGELRHILTQRDISDFCSANNISRSYFRDLYRGRTGKIHDWCIYQVLDREEAGLSQIQKTRPSLLKSHVFFDTTTGNTIQVNDLMSFCLERHLNYTMMARLSQGKAHSHKNYQSVHPSKKYQVYHVLGPDGLKYKFVNVAKFAKNIAKIPRHCLMNLVCGQCRSTHGWRLIEQPVPYISVDHFHQITY